MIASLRAENTKGKKRLNSLEAQKKTNSSLEDRLRAKFVSVRTERDKALMRLNQDLENITRLTNSNRAMVSDLRAAKAEVKRIISQIPKENRDVAGRINPEFIAGLISQKEVGKQLKFINELKSAVDSLDSK